MRRDLPRLMTLACLWEILFIMHATRQPFVVLGSLSGFHTNVYLALLFHSIKTTISIWPRLCSVYFFFFLFSFVFVFFLLRIFPVLLVFFIPLCHTSLLSPPFIFPSLYSSLQSSLPLCPPLPPSRSFGHPSLGAPSASPAAEAPRDPQPRRPEARGRPLNPPRKSCINSSSCELTREI